MENKRSGWKWLAGLALAGLTIGTFGYRAHASTAEPPSKMAADDAVKFDRSLTHVLDAQKAHAEIETAVKPYAEELQKIAAAYKINLNELGSTVRVDFISGEITRRPAPSPPQPAAPAPPQPPPPPAAAPKSSAAPAAVKK